jgi:hypothetical protein
MLADRPSVLRYVLFALALAGVGTATQCDGRRYKEYARVAPEPRTAIHFKYREGQVHALGIGEKPLFTSRPLLYKASDIENDPRTRWRRVEVPPRASAAGSEHRTGVRTADRHAAPQQGESAA